MRILILPFIQSAVLWDSFLYFTFELHRMPNQYYQPENEH